MQKLTALKLPYLYQILQWFNTLVNIEELMDDGVDLLFCNEQEALMYTNTTTVEDALTQLRFKTILL